MRNSRLLAALALTASAALVASCGTSGSDAAPSSSAAASSGAKAGFTVPGTDDLPAAKPGQVHLLAFNDFHGNLQPPSGSTVSA